MDALLDGPAGKPPLGVKPNMVDPPNLHTTTVATVAVCVAFGTLAVVIRFYTKMLLLRSTNLEDYLIVLALAGFISVTMTFAIPYMNLRGVHMWDLQLKEFFGLLHWFYIAGILYSVTVCLIKVAILLQYLRIFVSNRVVNMRLYVAIQATMWWNILFYLINTIFELVICTPREKAWNPLIKKGHCFNGSALNIATVLINVISDFSILILPMIPLWRLQMPLGRKFGVVAIFATGLCACIISIIRTCYSFRVSKSSDISYLTNKIAICTWTELAVGILISCMPSMPKFFRHVSDKTNAAFSSRSKSDIKPEGRPEPEDLEKNSGFRAPLRPLVDACDSNGSIDTGTSSYNDRNYDESERIMVENSNTATSTKTEGLHDVRSLP